MEHKSSTQQFLMVAAVVLMMMGLGACQEPTPATESPPVAAASPGPPTGTAVLPAPTVERTATGESAAPTVEQTETQEAALPPTGDAETAATALPTGQIQDPTPAGAVAEGMADLARADLARQLGVPEEAIHVESVEEVEWPDAGLGCPLPGMMYAQVITPGYRVVLAVEGQIYEYHTDRDRVVVLCGDLTASDPGAPDNGPLPIFVEVLQTAPLPDSVARMPPKDSSPTGVFSFNPADGLLLVEPSVEILPTTEVLVGLVSGQLPNRPYIASTLFQIPPAQEAPLTVVSIDADSGALTLVFAGQTFELSPGESRSFKQQGEGELATIEVTTITNHGRLAEIGLLPADPGGP